MVMGESPLKLPKEFGQNKLDLDLDKQFDLTVC